MVSAIFPTPLLVQEAPPAPLQLQEIFVRYTERLLVTNAPAAGAGPTGFETMIVYCTEPLAS